MRTLLAAVLLFASGAAVPAAAAPAGDRHAYCEGQWRGLTAADPARAAGHRSFMQRCLADCPDRRQQEDTKAYGARVRDYCEVRWQGLLAARETGGQTHDEFINTCLRRCVAGKGAPLGWILGGLGAAALAGAAAGASGGHSTTPPASP